MSLARKFRVVVQDGLGSLTYLCQVELFLMKLAVGFDEDRAAKGFFQFLKIGILVRFEEAGHFGRDAQQHVFPFDAAGELARFLLALKVSLAERDTAPTLVFDEVDSGVGGAVADAIGQRLARLAAKAQVLAVTHAPQVAARSNQHFRIVKNDVGKGERVATQVVALDASARREEIARMLAGAEVTGAARAAAKSLIEKAG